VEQHFVETSWKGVVVEADKEEEQETQGRLAEGAVRCADTSFGGVDQEAEEVEDEARGGPGGYTGQLFCCGQIWQDPRDMLNKALAELLSKVTKLRELGTQLDAFDSSSAVGPMLGEAVQRLSTERERERERERG
jgi:hypothetical protein